MSALETGAPELAHNANFVIETPRLSLRRPQMQDCERFTALLNNFNVAGNLARVTLPYTVDQAKQYLPEKSMISDPHAISFAIHTSQDGLQDSLIGNVGFHRAENGTTEIGYWLGEPYWGHGYMTEAMRAAISWFFEQTDSQYLSSGVFHFNMASLAIQYKLGFVETGRSTRRCAAREIDVEHIDTELNKEDFEASTS